MSTIKTNTLQNVAGTLSVPVDTVVQGSAKAWVNFNGIGTVAIRAAFNVSSITDNGTGDYTVNFTSALADGNYAAVGMATFDPFGNSSVPVVGGQRSTTPTSSSFRLNVNIPSSMAVSDATYVYVSFFR